MTDITLIDKSTGKKIFASMNDLGNIDGEFVSEFNINGETFSFSCPDFTIGSHSTGGIKHFGDARYGFDCGSLNVLGYKLVWE